jgi:aspartate 1-decarboxylase
VPFRSPKGLFHARRAAEENAMRTMLKSKIHRATVTGADINYEGSITLDPALMDAADIMPYEQVQILDVNNGSRLTTYAIEGEPDSGDVIINGAAARLVNQGDIVIILTYADVAEETVRDHKPSLVYVDTDNRITRIAEQIAA